MARDHLFFNPYKTFTDNLKTTPKQYDFLGFKVNSLFGMAACPATANSTYIQAAFDNGFDIVTHKTQRSVRFPANPFPNVLQIEIEGHLTPESVNNPLTGYLPEKLNPTHLTIANSFGNNSEGPEYWMKDFSKIQNNLKDGQVLILSIVGTIKEGFSEKDYYDDFAYTAVLGVKAGAKVIEVNLSCPNVSSEGVICYSPSAVVEICHRIREKVGPEVKLLAKIGYFNQNQEELLIDVVKSIATNFDGISAINTIAAPVVDRKGKQAFPGPGREKAGISGSAIKWAGIEMVGRLKSLRDILGYNYVIIGSGGVLTPNDYLDYARAGADVVQAATGGMWNPDLPNQIKSFLNAPYIDS